MSKQSNILSFDEMRRVSYASQDSVLSDSAAELAAQTGRYIPCREDVYDSLGFAAPAQPLRAASVSSERYSRYAYPSYDEYPAVEEYWSDAAVAARERMHARSARAADPLDAFDDPASNPEPAPEPERMPQESRRPSRLESLKRSMKKRVAERKYAKQFGGDESATRAQAEQAGPRAAVYKGEIGAKQRQASRMLEQDAVEPSRRRARQSSPWTRVVACLAVAACLVLSCAYLYPVAQTYYQTIRANDLLEAEYEAIAALNAELTSEIELLQTDSGIEQAAREELGWVMEDETLATVEGLASTGEEEDAEGDEDDVSAYVASINVEMPETWYSPILDVIFGVE